MKEQIPLVSFNRGIISRLGLARTDIDRLKLSAAIQHNWIPRTLGSMMLRPGRSYTGTTASNNKAYHIPFVYANDDTAILELTAAKLRVKISDTVLTRPSVATAITNGDMAAAGSWTDNDQSGATSGFTGGYMTLLGTGFNAARRTQSVSVAGGDVSVEHALRVIINRGEVTLKVGSSSGTDEYVSAVLLTPGEYSIAFLPTGTFYVDFSATTSYTSRVDSCTIEAAGAVELTTDYVEADLGYTRYEQSGNVVYLTNDGYSTSKIVRVDTGVNTYARRSFGVADYLPKDGPFRTINTTSLSLTPSATTGDITVTASQALFKSTNVGSLFRVVSSGQQIAATLSGEDQWSDPIRVVGSGASERTWTYISSGTWSATVTVQRSISAPGSWVDVTALDFTTNATRTYNDALTNQIVYYRVGIKAGEYTSGTLSLSLEIDSGSITGIFRVTDFSSSTSVSASVISPLGSTNSSTSWEEGEWSARRGYPAAVALHEGRLFLAGRSKLWGSVSDAYESFDDETEGDSGPISRTIGSGPVDIINWMVPSQRLLLGGEGAEWVARSSSEDEPLTPSNINLKDPSQAGSARVAAVKVDNLAVFVQKSGKRLFQTAYNLEANDYAADDLTKLIPEIAEAGIVRVVVQRQPDTRIHCVLENGRVAILILDSLENVKCWVTYSAANDGFIEDAVILPGAEEDYVYYCVKYTISAATKRYLERWAFESECARGTYIYEGASATVIPVIVDDDVKFPDDMVVTARDADGVFIDNYTVTNGAITLGTAATYVALTPATYKLVDSFITYSGASATAMSGLDHLEGETVAVFGDGKDLGTYTVASGAITLSEAVKRCVIGLPYTARYKSVKLNTIDRSGTSLGQPKIVNRLGVIMLDTHAQGLRYGPDFDNLDDLPLVEDGTDVDGDYVWPEFSGEYMEFDGNWNTDSRVCLEAASPLPCNLLAMVVSVRTNEKNSRDQP